MKAGICRLAALGMSVLLLAGCHSKATYNSGTFEGQGKGYSKDKDIKISVTIAEDGSIYEIKVLEADETKEVGGKALDELVKKALENNGEKIDTVSGATRTTEGFREALSEALNKASKSE